MTKGSAQIPNEVLTDSNLSLAEKVVYAIILGKYKQRGYCWVSNKTFSECTGKTIRHIRRIINSLEEKKYIKIKLDYTKTVTERQLTPLVVVEKQEDILSTTRRTCMSSNNTSSLKEKKSVKKKSDDFSTRWQIPKYQGTEPSEDYLYKKTKGVIDLETYRRLSQEKFPNQNMYDTPMYKDLKKEFFPK
jgi:hypothetical protein